MNRRALVQSDLLPRPPPKLIHVVQPKFKLSHLQRSLSTPINPLLRETCIKVLIKARPPPTAPPFAGHQDGVVWCTGSTPPTHGSAPGSNQRHRGPNPRRGAHRRSENGRARRANLGVARNDNATAFDRAAHRH